MLPVEFDALLTAAIEGRSDALRGRQRTEPQEKAAQALRELWRASAGLPAPLPIPDPSLLPPCF